MHHTLLRIVVLSALVLVTFPVVAMPGMSPAANARPPSLDEPGTAPASTPIPQPAAWTQLAPDLRAKVDPRIWKELNGEITPAYLGGRPEQADIPAGDRRSIGKTRFLVHLKAQADLDSVAARRFGTAADRRAAVADTLIATAQATQGPVKQALDTRMASGSVAAYQPLYIFNGFAVEGDLATIIELAQRADVERIVADYPLIRFDIPRRDSAPAPAHTLGELDPQNWNIDLVDAERVWSTLGITGTGAVVATFDTGADWTHPALQSRYRGYASTGSNHNYNWFEPSPTLYSDGNLGPSLSSVPYDCDGHGTHVTGTAVGDGGTSTTRIGMAPGAKWIAVPGICSGTMPGGYADDIGGMKAFQWLLCPTDLTGALATRDCAKAPDAINASWGSSNPADDSFRQAIRALRAAGIIPIFAAGNPEAGPGSISSPASVPEAIAVGATTISDTVATFSARGPSFYEGEQKPELSAPGVDVWSSVYGAYGSYSGTSMAAPHVTGLVALMVSADLRDGRRDFSVDELEAFMEHTAVDLGAAGPDGDYGYGRIDALKAVRWVLSAGDLRGLIRDTSTSAPIGGASVSGRKIDSSDLFSVRAAASGSYSVTVPGGSYDVTVSAFGFVTATFPAVGVITGVNSIVNFNLTPFPSAIVTGSVLSGTTPISGALVYVESKPGLAAASGADGIYALTLPLGAHIVVAQAPGYRIRRDAVTVATGGSTHGFAMAPAPTILLVEADAYYGWFSGRPAHNFFTWSLDRRDYLYDTAIITDTSNPPVLAPRPAGSLAGYDVVIWFHTAGSPNFGGFTTRLKNYLDAGGQLIISGQDIGYFDRDTTFYQDYLHATYLVDTAASEGSAVSGLNFLSGLDLTVSNAALYGYRNSALNLWPDGAAPRDGSAFPVLSYDAGNGAAALAVDACDPAYRVVYFSVGYENLGPRGDSRPPAYADLLDRSIQWETEDKPGYGSRLHVSPRQRIQPPGAVVTYSVALVNAGRVTDTYSLSLAGYAWPTRILSGTTEVAQTLPLAPCRSQNLTVEVDIPDTSGMGASDTFTLTATSQAAPTVSASVSATTTSFASWGIEAPMPTARYRFGAAATPDDAHFYAIGGWLDYFTTAANERYNACTGQWESKAPMPVPRANVGVAALNGKVYVVGGTDDSYNIYSTVDVYDPATNAWSSAPGLPRPLSGVAVAASGGKLYAFGGSDDTGFYASTYEYDPAANTWATKASMPGGARAYAAAATLSGKIYVAGGWPNLPRVEVYDPATGAWSAAASMHEGRQSPGLAAAPDGYLYVAGGGNTWVGLNSAERYNPAADAWLIISPMTDSNRAGAASAYAAGRIFAVGGVDFYPTTANESLRLLDSFCQSSKTVHSPAVQPGERITYTIELKSNLTTSNASAVDPIPSGTTFAGFGPASVSPGPTYNTTLNRVEWRGSLPAGQPPVTFTFGVTVTGSSGTEGQRILNTVTLSDSIHPAFAKLVTTRIERIDLSASTKMVNKIAAVAGEPLTYTIRVKNPSGVSGLAVISDAIPLNAGYVPGSLTYPVGSGGYADGVITWAGKLPPGIASTGYIYGDSDGGGSAPDVTFAWQDMSGATDTGVSADDGAYGPFPVGFTFSLYDDPAGRGASSDYAEFYVSPNGWVGFSPNPLGRVDCLDYGSSGDPDSFIGGFGGDGAVYAEDGGSIQYKVFGIAPRRYLVVQFTKLRYYYFSPSNTLDMQIILHEGSNAIKVQYRNLTTSPASAAVGIEGSAPGYPYLFYGEACPASNIHNDLALTFLPPGSVYKPSVTDITFRLTTSATLPANTWITNTTTLIDSNGRAYERSAATLLNPVNLAASRMAVDRAEAVPGEAVNYTIALHNTGLYTAAGAGVTSTIPANTTWTGAPPACTSGTCAHDNGVIRWAGGVAPGGVVSVTFGVTCCLTVSDGTPITGTAIIHDGTGSTLVRQAVFRLRAPNLAASYQTVSSWLPSPGDTVTFTVYVYNVGGGEGTVRLHDGLPTSLTYEPGSLIYGAGSGGYAGGVITWTGSVPPGSQMPIRFRTILDSSTMRGQVITNTAVITDVTLGIVHYAHMRLAVAFKHYLPLVLKSF